MVHTQDLHPSNWFLFTHSTTSIPIGRKDLQYAYSLNTSALQCQHGAPDSWLHCSGMCSSMHSWQVSGPFHEQARWQFSSSTLCASSKQDSGLVRYGDLPQGWNRDNLAKDVQSHFIRGPWLKQHNFHSKTYASNSKHHIYDRNMCPKHRDVNWMVYNRVIRFEMSPPEPFEICYFG